MTLDDLVARELIRHTLAAHNHAGDADDADGWVDTFTAEATLEAPGIHLRGRDALRGWKSSHTLFSSYSFRSHHVSSVLIEIDSAETASVRSNWLVTTDVGPDHSGRYSDRFRKVGTQWRIEHRLIEILWRSDRSALESEGSKAG